MEILIIESETYLAASLAQKLENDGYNCTISTPGASYSGKFDIVLLGTFFDPIKIIKEHEHAVIILLANYINSDITKALNAGASDYILKPVIIEEVKRKIAFFSQFKRMEILNKSYEEILQLQAQNLDIDEKRLSKFRLPLQIVSSKIQNSDIVVFSLAKSKNLRFARIKNNLSALNNHSQISYFYDFDTLSAKEQGVILASQNKKIIIRSTQDIAGYTKYELLDNSEPYMLPIDEYIKSCILEHQDAYNDTQLSQILGISRKSLWEKRRRYGITKRK